MCKIKIKTFLIVFLICIISFTEMPKAILVLDTYKQGIYNISDIREFNATAKLITPNNVTILILIDSNNNPKFYKKFDTASELINIGRIKNGDVLTIIGSGEIAITSSK